MALLLGMRAAKIKATYSLDVETIEELERWGRVPPPQPIAEVAPIALDPPPRLEHVPGHSIRAGVALEDVQTTLPAPRDEGGTEMAATVLQVNFKFGVTKPEYEELASSLGPSFAEVPGLTWKIWVLNEAESEAGGVYFFDSDESLQTFLGSQLAADVRDHPAVSDFSAKTFEVMDAVTTMTRGPVTKAVIA